MNRTPTLVAPKLAAGLKQPSAAPRPSAKSTKPPLPYAKAVPAAPGPAASSAPAVPTRSSPPPLPTRRLPPPLPTGALTLLADSDVREDKDELPAVSHSAPPAPPLSPRRRGPKVVAIALSISALVATSFAASWPGQVARSADAGSVVVPAARGIEVTTSAPTAQVPKENPNALARKPAQQHAGKTAKPPQRTKVANTKASKATKLAKRSQRTTGKRPSAPTKRTKASPP